MSEGRSLERMSNLVSKISSILSIDQSKAFVRMLKDRGFAHPTYEDMDKLGLSPSSTSLLEGYIKGIKDKEGLFAISLSLLENAKRDLPSPVEICWTGPSDNRNIRKTWPALADMILSAKNSILMAGYAINTNMGSIMDYLEDKSRSGVRLTFMIDRLEEKEDFLRWAKRLPLPPELYDRPMDPMDPMSALHVKCVIIDEKYAMFGSANLTYHGMKGNLELGLILKDKETVKSIVDLLNGLKGELIRYDLYGLE